MKRLIFPSLIFIVLSIFYSCQKKIEPLEQENKSATTLPNNTNNTSSGLSYGDTVFYLKNQTDHYTILPVSVPNSAGYFKAGPNGLNIDSVTGKINVTLSETGLRYKIYYLSPAGAPIDSVKIVISGIDYADSIYRIVSTPNAYDTAFPIYNAKPNPPLPCNEDDDDEDFGCTFDETDLDGDGNDDITGVNQEKLLVNEKIGTIDVEASYHAGVFPSNPGNGYTRDFTFYYRLYDQSNRALNKITVRLYHFNTIADIPQWLLDEMNRRKNVSSAVNARSSSGAYSERIEQASGPKRPPIIIIVSS